MKALALCILTVSSASLAFADISLFVDNPANPAYWAANNGPTDGVSDSYFWDHVSYDGAYCNIGYFLNGSVQPASACLDGKGNDPAFNPVGSPNLPFFSSSRNGSTPPPDFHFIPDSPVTTIDYAGFRAYSETFGYYLESAPGTRIQLFASNAPASSATFTPGGAFGFYLMDPDGVVFTTDANPGQFALFDDNADTAGLSVDGTSLTDFWIGSKDVLIPGGDRDYNDTIVNVRSYTPEPRYSGLVSLGMLGFLLGDWRRRRSRQVPGGDAIQDPPHPATST
jgi:hypothetical protein